MGAASERWRLVVFTGLVILSFIGLGCRLVDLQWTRHEQFVTVAEGQHEHIYFREASRGDIRDRRGNVLATSVPVKTVCADPSLLVGREAEMAQFLAPLLNINETFLLQQLNRHTNDDGLAKLYVRLKQKVPCEQWEKIQLALAQQYTNQIAGRKLRPKEKTELLRAWTMSIMPEDDQIRTYPNGQLGAHVLGYIGSKEIIAKGRTNSITEGREGVEAVLNEQLHGTVGWVKTETDIHKREIYVFREQDVESHPGLNVVLTIDARIQQMVEEEILPVMAKYLPQSVSAMVVRPKTGEILAMANLPTFDPSMPGKYTDPAVRRNRLVTDVFEPGSTFKTVTLAGALNDGVVRLTDTFDCENGEFFFAGKRLGDHEHYGVLSVQRIIAKSSNIGTAKVAIRLGPPRTYKYITDFGFGEKTGIPLTGEVRGILPPLKAWKPIHISRIPIGQGVAATPLQTTMAMCAVANGGILMRPMLVDSLVDEKGATVAKYKPVAARRVISEATAKAATEALKSVVEAGTAEKAALEYYSVAGKTGTAQKVDTDGKYSHDKYFSSFLGFLPADNPELCVAIFVDEPVKKIGYYGGYVAAPVFKRIAERAANFLNIKPDLSPVRPNDVMEANAAMDRAGVTQVTPR